jgi:hypothetical protein
VHRIASHLISAHANFRCSNPAPWTKAGALTTAALQVQCLCPNCATRFRRVLYILRDGRDVMESYLRFRHGLGQYLKMGLTDFLQVSSDSSEVPRRDSDSSARAAARRAALPGAEVARTRSGLARLAQGDTVILCCR